MTIEIPEIELFGAILVMAHHEYIPWIAVSVLALLIIITILIFSRPLLRVGSHKPSALSANEEEPGAVSSTLPKASVIVETICGDERLTRLLDQLTTQDYPNYEIILVCETTSESREILLEEMHLRYPGIYVTFIPPGTSHLSKRKLSITLGMKAAKGDVAITTISNAEIPSISWLSTLMAPFIENPEIEIVLGYSAMDFSAMKGWGKWYREFNTLLTDVSWISSAMRNKPFRGDGYNLAINRELFFRHKGYSKTYFLHSGDDDLFINEVANDKNTSVVLSPNSNIKVDWEDASKRMWRLRKDQYQFTSRWLPRGPFRMSGWLSAMQWVILLTALCSILIGLPTIWPAVASAALLLIFWQSEICIYRRVATRMEATRLWWSLPLFYLLRAPLNAIFRIRNRRDASRNFTWDRGNKL